MPYCCQCGKPVASADKYCVVCGAPQPATPHPGADTVNINQTLVGNGISDANGDFAVPNLKGTGQYLIKVAGPAGTNFGPASVIISQAYVDPVRVLVTLHGR